MPLLSLLCSRFCLLLLLSLCSMPAVAMRSVEQVPALDNYFKESMNTRNGLPHNTINAIAQTADGYLWFGTWEGVARYNGREFRIFDRSPETGLLTRPSVKHPGEFPCDHRSDPHPLNLQQSSPTSSPSASPDPDALIHPPDIAPAAREHDSPA